MGSSGLIRASGPCLSSARRVGLGVHVADLLQLLRTLAGHRVAAHPADEHHALAGGVLGGQLGDLLLLLQDLADLAGQRLEAVHDAAAVGRREVVDPSRGG